MNHLFDIWTNEHLLLKQRTSIINLRRIKWHLRKVQWWQWAGVGLLTAFAVNRRRDYLAALWRQYVA